MLKATLALGVVLVMFVAESTSVKIIQPTFRPPRPLPKLKPIRIAREVGELTSISSENVPVSSINEVELLDRTARSLDSPGAKRGDGSHSTSSGSRDTGATHPGYNRRNAREIRLPGHLNPLRPKPLFPRPSVPAPVPRIPIYARTARDIQFPGIRKPTHRDVIIPNWNPHVRTNPWDSLGGRRHARSIDLTEETINNAEFDDLPHERETRDIQIGGLPRKPTHRDVIIPNWNPHIKTSPWGSIGGRGRHRRSTDFTEDMSLSTDEEFKGLTYSV